MDALLVVVAVVVADGLLVAGVGATDDVEVDPECLTNCLDDVSNFAHSH